MASNDFYFILFFWLNYEVSLKECFTVTQFSYYSLNYKLLSSSYVSEANGHFVIILYSTAEDTTCFNFAV